MIRKLTRKKKLARREANYAAVYPIYERAMQGGSDALRQFCKRLKREESDGP